MKPKLNADQVRAAADVLKYGGSAKAASYFSDVLGHLRELGTMTTHDLAEFWGISTTTARKYVGQLVETGHLSRPHYRAIKEGPWLNRRSQELARNARRKRDRILSVRKEQGEHVESYPTI